MKKSTQLYKSVEGLLCSMPDVETEWLTCPSNRARDQLSRIADRLSIMQEVIHGMLDN